MRDCSANGVCAIHKRASVLSGYHQLKTQFWSVLCSLFFVFVVVCCSLAHPVFVVFRISLVQMCAGLQSESKQQHTDHKHAQFSEFVWHFPLLANADLPALFYSAKQLQNEQPAKPKAVSLHESQTQEQDKQSEQESDQAVASDDVKCVVSLLVNTTNGTGQETNAERSTDTSTTQEQIESVHVQPELRPLPLSYDTIVSLTTD